MDFDTRCDFLPLAVDRPSNSSKAFTVQTREFTKVHMSHYVFTAGGGQQ